MRLLKLILIPSLLMPLAGCDKKDPKPAVNEDDVSVFFSPETDPADLISKLIRQSTKSIRMQAYSFKSEKIAKALVAAKRNGVDVKVIIDADKAEDKSEANFLRKRGIATYIDSKHTKAHNKIILIDGETVITGSYNFTPDEDKNPKADNVLVMTRHPALMAAYQKNFEDHLDHSDLKE